MKLNSLEKLQELCLKEMFLRVGLTYPDTDFTSDPKWFCKKEWTKEEENSFRDWMVKLLYSKLKNKYWSKKRVEFSTDMFLLNYGWKYKEESEKQSA